MSSRLPFAARRDLCEREVLEPTLGDVLAAIAELRAAVAPELAARVALLAALRDAFGTAAFTALDALERAAEAPEGAALPAAMTVLIGGPVGGLRRLSRRLAKLVGKPAGGMVLVRIGDDRGSALYVIQTAQ